MKSRESISDFGRTHECQNTAMEVMDIHILLTPSATTSLRKEIKNSSIQQGSLPRRLYGYTLASTRLPLNWIHNWCKKIVEDNTPPVSTHLLLSSIVSLFFVFFPLVSLSFLPIILSTIHTLYLLPWQLFSLFIPLSFPPFPPFASLPSTTRVPQLEILLRLADEAEEARMLRLSTFVLRL